MNESDLDRYYKPALEDVIETIISFAQYPRPRRDKRLHVEFDLYDFCADVIDPSDAMEYMLLSLSDQSNYGVFSESRMRWEKKISALLEGSLKVQGLALELANEWLKEELEMEKDRAQQNEGRTV